MSNQISSVSENTSKKHLKRNTENNNRREIGDEALSWKLSSAKSGHGVQQLRDNSLTTFWQSDGISPHRITILFDKKHFISEIEMYCDYKLDESYTPHEIQVKASISLYEEEIILQEKLHEPNGWVVLQLKPHSKQYYYNNNQYKNTFKCLKTNKIIIEILSSHQQGRDTHIRQIKIYSPRIYTIHNNNSNNLIDNQPMLYYNDDYHKMNTLFYKSSKNKRNETSSNINNNTDDNIINNNQYINNHLQNLINDNDNISNNNNNNDNDNDDNDQTMINNDENEVLKRVMFQPFQSREFLQYSCIR